MSRFVGCFSAVPILLLAAVAQAGITTDGASSAGNVTTPAGAVGSPVAGPGSNFGDDITPFTPPFEGIAIIGNTTDLTTNTQASSLTLHFASPVKPGIGPDIGVYTNIGLVAAFDNNTSTITAAAGPQFFSNIPQRAIVSVSFDNAAFLPLNSGNAMELGMVSNQFSNSQLIYDTTFQYVSASGGTTPTDPYKPYTGTLASFAGQTYSQMAGNLNGSFGGMWIDASGSGLQEINYIRFEVPQGANYRLVLDAVTAVSPVGVPEPATVGISMLTVGTLVARRRRRT